MEGNLIFPTLLGIPSITNFLFVLAALLVMV